MAATKFVIELELGNEAMKMPADIADTLQHLAEVLLYTPMTKDVRHSIVDINGNVCGSWSYK